MDETANRISKHLLEQIQLFRSVDIESIRGIFDHCSVMTLQAKEILISPGQFNWKIYFVLTGTMRVHLGSLESDPISYLGPGESVGEMSVIDLQPTSAYVVADEDSSLLSLDEDILWSLVRSSHIVACNLLYLLTKRLRKTDSILSGGIQVDREDYAGYMDALTGLPSREWLFQVLVRQYQRASTAGEALSLILIDVDQFKAFNDRHGKACGDRMMYAIAYTLKNHLRPTEIIARFGGDRFAILLPDTDMGIARTVAVRLYENLKQKTPVIFEGRSVEPPTVSMGVAQMKPEQDVDTFLAETDAALYRAKQGGGDAISE